MKATSADAKALALSHSSVLQLKKLSLWELLQPYAEAIKEVRVSNKGTFGLTRILAKDYDLEALGYVVNADYLTSVLQSNLQSSMQERLRIFQPDEIIKHDQNGHIKIQLKSGVQITTDLLVAADGTDSKLRDMQGIGAKYYDYQQIALALNLTISDSHHHIAYERFTENTSIALLPFGEKQVKCVWVLPTDRREDFLNSSDEIILQNIQAQIGDRLGEILTISKTIIYPLRSVISDSVYRRNFVLIGNAAHTLHPIAAQGFNLGLRDASCLAETITQAYREGKRIGSIDVLQQYAKRRETDHHHTSFATHQLTNAAESNQLQWSILMSEWISPLKHWIAKTGMGQNFKYG